MASSSVMEVAFGTSISLFAAILWYFKPAASDVFVWVVKCILGLGIVTLLFHYFSRIRSFIANKYFSVSSTEQTDETREIEQQRIRREEAQQRFDQQANEYNEKILQPRLEAKKKKKDDEFYRFKGAAWKGERHRLGGSGGSRCEAEGNRPAAEARTMPDPPLNYIFPQYQPPKKLVIELPPEPEEGSTDAVTIVFRTPQGRNHKRRFLTSDHVQLLLDFITTVGYHRKLHRLVTSYPRHTLDPRLTLAQAGVNRNMALNVEEILPGEEEEEE